MTPSLPACSSVPGPWVPVAEHLPGQAGLDQLLGLVDAVLVGRARLAQQQRVQLVVREKVLLIDDTNQPHASDSSFSDARWGGRKEDTAVREPGGR